MFIQIVFRAVVMKHTNTELQWPDISERKICYDLHNEKGTSPVLSLVGGGGTQPPSIQRTIRHNNTSCCHCW